MTATLRDTRYAEGFARSFCDSDRGRTSRRVSDHIETTPTARGPRLRRRGGHIDRGLMMRAAIENGPVVVSITFRTTAGPTLDPCKNPTRPQVDCR
jgi:hypothetical protein